MSIRLKPAMLIVKFNKISIRIERIAVEGKVTLNVEPRTLMCRLGMFRSQGLRFRIVD